MLNLASMVCSVLCSLTLFVYEPFCLSSAAKGRSKSDEATMKVVMFMMMVKKIVSMPMVNSSEDLLDIISPFSTVHRSVSAKPKAGDHSNFTIFWRPAVC